MAAGGSWRAQQAPATVGHTHGHTHARTHARTRTHGKRETMKKKKSKPTRTPGWAGLVLCLLRECGVSPTPRKLPEQQTRALGGTLPSVFLLFLLLQGEHVVAPPPTCVCSVARRAVHTHQSIVRHGLFTTALPPPHAPWLVCSCFFLPGSTGFSPRSTSMQSRYTRCSTPPCPGAVVVTVFAASGQTHWAWRAAGTAVCVFLG